MQSEPVLLNSILTIVGTLLAPLLAKYGIDADGTAKILGFVGVGVSAIVAVLGVVNARAKVSPVPKPAPIGTTLPPVAPVPEVAV